MPAHRSTSPTDPWDIAISRPARIDQAHKAWLEAGNTISIRKIARQYGIHHSTLEKRIYRAIPAVAKQQSSQRLTPEEEIVIKR